MMLALRSTIAALLIIAAACAAHEADGRITRFWNLTGETITHLYLAPTGTTSDDDPDGGVDFDERLHITSVSSGKYDVRFTDKTGRSCIVKDVDIKEGATFSIDREAVGNCSRR
jgi:hypothetical protein